LKQKYYFKKLQQSYLSSLFSVPKVVTNDKSSFTMEYIYGKSPTSFVETSTVQQIKHLIDSLFLLIDWEYHYCEKQYIPKEKFMDKLKTIPVVPKYATKIEELIYANNRKIPIGFCHGDLTLSNVIISDKIYLIDLHDPFMESPIQDVFQ